MFEVAERIHFKSDSPLMGDAFLMIGRLLYSHVSLIEVCGSGILRCK